MSSASAPADAPPIILVWSAGPSNETEYAGTRISEKRGHVRDRISQHLASCGERVEVLFSEDESISELAGRVGWPRREALWSERVDLIWSIAVVAIDVPTVPLTVRPELSNVLLPMLESESESLILRSALVLWPQEFIEYVEGRNPSYDVRDPSAELLWHRIAAINARSSSTVIKVIAYSEAEFRDCSLAARVASLLEGVTIEV